MKAAKKESAVLDSNKTEKNPDFLYRPKTFSLHGLRGISDPTLEMHFKLYEGYVKETNLLNGKIAEILGKGKIEANRFPSYSEMKRRLGFEYNGMVLHEYYFGNLKRNASAKPASDSLFLKQVERDFGDYELWKADFFAVGEMRGVGWAICCQDPRLGRLSNHWIELHETGNIAGFKPILVMDVWEHAFLLDHKPSEREKYIEAFFANIDWEMLDVRLRRSIPTPVAEEAE